MHLARHYRLDLPEFPRDSEVLSRDNYTHIHSYPHLTSFVRNVFLGYAPLYELGLVKILKIAKQEGQILAEKCNAQYVDPEFGLIRSSSEPQPGKKQNSDQIVPFGYRLVAEVPVISNFVCFDNDDIDTNSFAYTSTKQGVTKYILNQESGNYYLSDSARIDQFGIDADNVTWLIDPDPILRQKI